MSTPQTETNDSHLVADLPFATLHFASLLSYCLPPNVKWKFKWASAAQQQPIRVCQIIIDEQTLIVLFLTYSLEKCKEAFPMLLYIAKDVLTKHLQWQDTFVCIHLLEVCFCCSCGEQSWKKTYIWMVFEILQNFKNPYYSCAHLIKIHLDVFVML